MITVIGFLGILFVGLKLTGYIAWSWYAVCLPLAIVAIDWGLTKFGRLG